MKSKGLFVGTSFCPPASLDDASTLWIAAIFKTFPIQFLENSSQKLYTNKKVWISDILLENVLIKKGAIKWGGGSGANSS